MSKILRFSIYLLKYSMSLAHVHDFVFLEAPKCSFLLILLRFYRCFVKLEFLHFGGSSDVSILRILTCPTFLDFHRLSIVLISPGPLTMCYFDSRQAFKVKVSSHESTPWGHDLGGSPTTKIMKFHDFNFDLFPFLISITLVFSRLPNVCFC